MAKLVKAVYGDALFELAVEENKTDALFEEAQAVLASFNENRDLIKFLNHPKIENEKKQEVIENVYEKFVSKDMTGFLVLIVSKGRYNDIPAILTYFIDKVKEYKHIGVAYVTSAKELNAGQKAAIEEKLLKTTKYQSFEMKYKIDESLIGGMIIRIGDRVVDSSIKTKLSGLSSELLKIQLN
ncbi:MAG: ATP synthase F1 subunit delta [Thermoflexaceae bacterium]|nr:ATP synthase F1 subunit delta [Thermoflexaceae bacterium]